MGVVLSLAGTESHAQLGKELFQQKKTQKAYLIKQILLLKTYLGYAKKGYDIANKGLTLINSIKNGDFDLHSVYFASLKNVNPHISSYAKVTEIIAFQMLVAKNISKVYCFCKDNAHFTVEEVRYVTAVHSNMLQWVEISRADLYSIIHSNETEMKDDERLLQIDKIYSDILDKHAFVNAFEKDVFTIATEREREKNAIDAQRKQHELI